MEELREITIGRALREQAEKNRNKEFIVFANRNIRRTFGDVDKKADDLAKALLAAGFKKGDHIGIWANNVPEWETVFFAAARVGVVAVPINANYKHIEAAYIIEQADIKGLFIIDHYRSLNYAEMLSQLLPDLCSAELDGVKSEKFPYLKTIITIDNTARAGMYTLEQFIEKGASVTDSSLQDAEKQVDAASLLCIMYSSGTTGNYKGAMLTHTGVINNAFYANEMNHVNINAVVLNPLPLFHIMSLTDGLIEVLLFGAKAVITEYFDPAQCLEIIQKEKCTMMYAVPAMYTAMLNHPMFETFNPESLKHGYIGGAPCPAELAKSLLEKLRLQCLSIGYGLTETSPLVCRCFISDASDQRLKTIGAPIPGVTVCIRDSGNKECPVNVKGEICVKGYNVMKGYYKMEQATKEVIDNDGWFHTGDIGYMMPDGYFVIDGRIKELIIRGGENISPKEVENILLTMPCVRDAQVAGIPSKKYGEEVGAFVILKERETAVEKDIVEFCKERISLHKTPKFVFFMDSFPWTASGKVQKFKLTEFGLKQIREKGIAT